MTSMISTVLPIKLDNLTHIFIEICYIKFDDFEIFIKKVYSKLKSLCVIIESQDIFYLNAIRWENLINESLPYLEKIIFTI